MAETENRAPLASGRLAPASVDLAKKFRRIAQSESFGFRRQLLFVAASLSRLRPIADVPRFELERRSLLIPLIERLLCQNCQCIRRFRNTQETFPLCRMLPLRTRRPACRGWCALRFSQDSSAQTTQATRNPCSLSQTTHFRASRLLTTRCQPTCNVQRLLCLAIFQLQTTLSRSPDCEQGTSLPTEDNAIAENAVEPQAASFP